jgi:myo-inositol-1(or 4)-monophosphatase
MASEVDYAIERDLREFLADKTPAIGFMGEEEGPSGPAGGLAWALDPVDGTVNFIHGSPLCGISLALLDDSRPVLGVIDLPFLRMRFTAVESHGAHQDGRPIRASGTTSLSEAVVAIGDYAVGDGAADKNRERLAITHRLAATVQRVRMHGSAAIDLAWLAAGRVDAVVMLSNRAWNVAAGVIIAREAGAIVSDRDGTPHNARSRATIGTTPGILDEVFQVIGAKLDHRRAEVLLNLDEPRAADCMAWRASEGSDKACAHAP